MRKSTDPLPELFASLITTVASHHPDNAENRRALAELEARLALAQDRTARNLTWATWALVLATLGLLVSAFLAG